MAGKGDSVACRHCLHIGFPYGEFLLLDYQGAVLNVGKAAMAFQIV